MADVHKYRARWVFTGNREPISDATVVIDGDRIAEIHTLHQPGALDLGNVALIPGLVNCHTHLEFSDLVAPISLALPFTHWIRGVVAARRHRMEPQGQRIDAIGAGLREAATSGTTTVGEIATRDESLPHNRGANPHVVVFREILGLRPDQIDAQLATAEAHVHRTSLARGVRHGLSPHAPYSVHPDLLTRLIDLAVAAGAPVAMHVAETPAERELLERGTGEFAEMLRALGVWTEGVLPRGLRPLDYLRQLARAERALVVHGNCLDADEQAFVAAKENLAVVYCPRTHAYFGHTPHSWRALLARGARVALGTDSRASNPDLSLWREVQFLRQRFPDVPPAALLRLATLDGARALGLDAHTGSLSPGKSADLCAIALPTRDGEPWSLLLDPAATVTRTMVAGRWIGE